MGLGIREIHSFWKMLCIRHLTGRLVGESVFHYQHSGSRLPESLGGEPTRLPGKVREIPTKEDASPEIRDEPKILDRSHLRSVFLRALRASVVNPIVNLKSEIVNGLALTPCSQPKAIVANCRFSKIRPKTYTLNLNTRNAGLQTGKSPAIPASSPSLNTLEAERGQPVRCSSPATAVQHHRESLQHVAPCRSVLHRVAPKIFRRPWNLVLGTSLVIGAWSLVILS